MNELESNSMLKCPKCGASDVDYDEVNVKWSCAYCREVWSTAAFGSFEDFANLEKDLRKLEGSVIVGAAKKIESYEAQITLKCGGCGAEVIVNTDSSVTSRCHWCRQTLSLNSQVANGAVPDAMIPFSVSKAEAVKNIAEFVKKRKAFASKEFSKQFNAENVIGVYLPYALVSANSSAEIVGKGEILVEEWTEKVNDSKTTYYSANRFKVERKFNFQVEDLYIEASQSKADLQTGAFQKNTNNIINSILPFDYKKTIPYKSVFMHGFNSEKRDIEVETMLPIVQDQLLSISRSEATRLSAAYDRGVAWEEETLELKGVRWVSTYLPVWLYSYYDEKTKLLHYVAVNGSTGETMGSVPVNYKRLVVTSCLIGLLGEIPLLIGSVTITTSP